MGTLRTILTFTLITIASGALAQSSGPFLPPDCDSDAEICYTPPEFGRFSSCLANRAMTILAFGALGAAASWDVDQGDVMALKLEASPFDDVIDFGNTWGSGYVIGGGSLATYATGALTGHDGLRTLGTDLCRAYALSGVVTMTLKRAVDRRRPTGGRYSFPSGHTSSAFCIVPAMWHHHGWKGAAPATALGIITAMGRMQERHHYLSDVIFGAALGLAAGDVAIRVWRLGPESGGVVLTPGGVGYTAAF